jgi:hypothetical protein
MNSIYCNYCNKNYKSHSYINHCKTKIHNKNILNSKPLCNLCKTKNTDNIIRDLLNEVLCNYCYNIKYKQYLLENKPKCIKCQQKDMSNKHRELDNKIYCDTCYSEQQVITLANSSEKMAELIIKQQQQIIELISKVEELTEETEEFNNLKYKVDEIEKDLDHKVDKEYSSYY